METIESLFLISLLLFLVFILFALRGIFITLFFSLLFFSMILHVPQFGLSFLFNTLVGSEWRSVYRRRKEIKTFLLLSRWCVKACQWISEMLSKSISHFYESNGVYLEWYDMVLLSSPPSISLYVVFCFFCCSAICFADFDVYVDRSNINMLWELCGWVTWRKGRWRDARIKLRECVFHLTQLMQRLRWLVSIRMNMILCSLLRKNGICMKLGNPESLHIANCGVLWQTNRQRDVKCFTFKVIISFILLLLVQRSFVVVESRLSENLAAQCDDDSLFFTFMYTKFVFTKRES